MPRKNSVVVALVGPTCTGKTALSLELAEKLSCEIIACDSRTVYRGMDIGTAKPSPEEQKRATHHMLDVLDPDRFFTVAEFKEKAEPILTQSVKEERAAIVCGGTGLYARALLEGIVIPKVEPHQQLRNDLNMFADTHGNIALHRRLEELDAVTANRLSVNDRVRVIRAIEVSLIGGKPFSEAIAKEEPPFKTLWLGLFWQDREEHRRVISQRFDQQIENGLVKEVENLFGLKRYEAVLNRAVNYKEFVPYIKEEVQLDVVRAMCILHNYQLARKQMLWFRGNKQINWFAVDQLSHENILEKAIDLIDRS
jgi:tRNA dimethylallyltransferase